MRMKISDHFLILSYDKAFTVMGKSAAENPYTLSQTRIRRRSVCSLKQNRRKSSVGVEKTAIIPKLCGGERSY
jgi:hypothetical protein